MPVLPRCSPGVAPSGWMLPGIASAALVSVRAYASGARRAPGIVTVACSVLEVADMTTTMPAASPGQNHPQRVDVFRRRAMSRAARVASVRSEEKDLDFERKVVPLSIWDSPGPYGAVQCGAWVASQAHVRAQED